MAVGFRRHGQNPYDDEELDRQALLHQMGRPAIVSPERSAEIASKLEPRVRPVPDRSIEDFMRPDQARTLATDVGGQVDVDTGMAPTGAQPRNPGGPANTSRGYSLLDAYDDPYERRNEGSGGVLSNAAKYAQAGASVGSAFAGVGAVPGAIIGGIGGAIGGAFSKNAKSAMTDFSAENAREVISNAHRDALGREIAPEYLDEIMRGQGWKQGDEWFGEEPLAYVLDQFATHAQLEGEQGAAADAAQAAQTAAPAAGAVATGAAPGGRAFTGFDFGQDAANRDPQKSAKYAYALAVQQAPPLTDPSKEGSEAWFRQHIAPIMESYGHEIFDVQGDKAWIGSVEDPEGRVPVDYMKNAGLDSAEFAWQPETGGEGGAGAAGASGATNAQDAYSYLTSIVSPGASKEEMEAAITSAFGAVPGFEEAYKESVKIDGQWYDLVRSYGGADAAFQGLTPKVDGQRAGGTSSLLGQSSALTQSLLPTDNDFYLRLMREVQDLANGGRGGTMDRDALVNLLKAA